MTAVATTSSFEGADVDGLDRLAQEFTQAAQVCNEVKAACEVIVAAASFFGPFGAAFVAYLKGVVIPWLTKIAEALQLMAKVLSVHSQAQKDASSSSTSLPTYRTPANLPQTSTGTYPLLSAVGGPAESGRAETPGPETKPLAPGTIEYSKAFGAVMDRETLAEFAGKEPSYLHPTISLGQMNGSVSAWTTSGEHYSVAAGELTGSAAAWMGYDPKDGYQLGAGVSGGANLLDVKLVDSVPLGGDSRLNLGNQTTLGVNGAAQLGAGYNPTTGTATAGASASVFAGVQNTTTVEVQTPYFTDRTDLTGQLGAGAAADATVEIGGGHLVINAGAGATIGLGGKVSNSLDINYDRIATDAVTGIGELETSAETVIGSYFSPPPPARP